MKSIANQYRDLKEGKMTQQNFMRNLRMSMPQFITNVTSFNDAVRILKNKSILTETVIKEELDTKKVYGGTGQNQGDTGSSLQFTVIEDNPEYFEIDFTLSPNSKYRQAGAGSRSPREKEYGYAKILKKDFNGQITVKGENFNIGKDFITANLQTNKDNEVKPSEDELDAMIKKMEDEKAGEEAIMSQYDLEEAKSPISKDQKIQVIKEWIWYCFDEGTKEEPIQKWNAKIDEYFADKDDVTFLDFKNIWNEMTYEIGVGDVGADSEGFSETWKDIQKGILNNPEKTYEELNEAKKKEEKIYHIHQVNPTELRLGIRTELEHGDMELDKAKEIAYKNITKDPIYYTTLKLSGVEAHPKKVKGEKEVPVKKAKKESAQLVDLVNGMQKVKMPKADEKKKIKESVDEKMYFADMPADPEKYKMVRDSKGYIIKATNADGVEFQKGDTVKTYDGEEIKIAKFEESQGKVKAIYNKGMFFASIDIDGLEAPKPTMRPGVDMGASFEKMKRSLEEIVRETISEYFDGRDNLINPLSAEDENKQDNE